MHQFKDLSGQRFGRLVCVRRVGRDKQGRTIWQCECDCGNFTKVILPHLTGGKIRSCGCLQRERATQSNITHGLSGGRNKTTRLYSIWRNMKQRCYNPKAAKFDLYGGRGITVCEQWHSFPNFYYWAIMNGYSPDLSIDRKDNDNGYSPENCRWVTIAQQNTNKSNQHFVSYDGKKHTLSEWSKILGMKYSTLKARLVDYDWPVEKAFNTPVRRR